MNRFLTTAAAALMVFSLGAAHADPRSRVRIDQSGYNNGAAAAQQGSRNGTVIVHAVHQGRRLVLEVIDDGAGLPGDLAQGARHVGADPLGLCRRRERGPGREDTRLVERVHKRRRHRRRVADLHREPHRCQ